MGAHQSGAEGTKGEDVTPPHAPAPASTDHAGRRWCALCGLPDTNQVHDLSEAPTVNDEVSRRVLGENEEEGEA